jgi:predicted HD phosphohydrolase
MRDVREVRSDLESMVALLDAAGSLEEPNEDIAGLTILHHGLQCAEVLRRADPTDVELQLAGLLHDVGHVLAPGCEDAHGEVGAAYVRPVLGARVAALIEAHVPAKRYLVTTDDSYRAGLSTGSIRTLAVQGDVMAEAELATFRSHRYAAAAVRLRRADDQAKDPTAMVPDLAAWLPVLERRAG